MANNKKQNSSPFYWVATAFMLINATPVGVLMILFKLFETKNDKKTKATIPGTPVGARTTGGARVVRPTTDALAPLAKKAGGRVKKGTVLTALCALLLASVTGNSLSMLVYNFPAFLQNIWFSLCCTAVSGAYLASGLSLRKKVNRYRRYLTMIGARHSIPVSTLSSASNIAPKQVRADLEDMLDLGLLAEGYLDHMNDRLVLSSGGVSDPTPRTEPEPTPEPKRETPADRENAILAEIRAVNDLVQDEKISAQIDKIGMLTARILDYEKSHPQSAPQLHSFLSYYLPTTLKILRAYGQLEAQEVRGENITAAMRRIEDMMDKVVEGFEKQLDRLFLGESIDVTADVEVLERMLAKDGLAGGQNITLQL